MINGNKVLAIVPARAGSKGLPGKNSKILAGKPLVQYSLEAGLTSKYIDDVILTSNCPRCMSVAENMGVMVPFSRPESLSGDRVKSSSVIIHTVNYLKKHGREYQILVLLEPTSPLRTSHDIDAAFEKMMVSSAKSMVSVCLAEEQHPDFMLKLVTDHRLKSWNLAEFQGPRRQDLLEAYFQDGSIYISFIEEYMKIKSFVHSDTAAFKMPKWKSFEVDDLVDFICVDALMKYKNIEELENLGKS